MPLTMPSLESLTVTISEEIHVRASVEATFEALLAQMGPENATPDGTPMPMTIEPFPGGRWFRDLGNDNGHYWGSVQAIKRPTLLEITGPLFLSSPVVSNVQYRLKATDAGTIISFRHSAFGFVPDEFRDGMPQGWKAIFDRVKRHAETRPTAH